MYRLTIGVGASIFRDVFAPEYNEVTALFSKISQHRFILNEDIINYYYENLPESLHDYLQSFLDSVMCDDSSEFVSSSGDEDIRIEMVNVVAKQKYKTLIAYDNEFNGVSTKRIKLVTPKDIVENRKLPFNRFSLPVVNYSAEPGDECAMYSRWFTGLFENEKSIQIVDPYILTNHGLKVLNKYYLPLFEEGSVVDIYCDFSHCDCANVSDLYKKLDNDLLKSIEVNFHFCENMHERYIITTSFQLTIGAGLDFLCLNGNVNKICIINISNENRTAIPSERKLIGID